MVFRDRRSRRRRQRVDKNSHLHPTETKSISTDKIVPLGLVKGDEILAAAPVSQSSLRRAVVVPGLIDPVDIVGGFLVPEGDEISDVEGVISGPERVVDARIPAAVVADDVVGGGGGREEDGSGEEEKEEMRVRVQAGARVSQLVDGIKDYGLTLQNFASIREQQLGGIVQVGAHGTGARLPPIDEQIISMKLVTPAKGTIEVSSEKDPELFYLARCGLGGLGVVAEVTIQCVERQELVEHTFVSNIKEIKKNHKKWLADNKHVKYLWIPYTDTVVVVQCNPLPKWKGLPKFKPKYSNDEALQDVRELYRDSLQKYRTVETGTKPSEGNELDINELSFTELRDKLLALNPLNKEHVIKVNQAEAEYWRKSEGYRVGWSDEILGFDCGGEQWVSETCFPAGTLSKPSMKDLDYMEELKQLIQNEGIPAPAPIEQRWTARSQSLMSPASSPVEEDIFSWVGIIMYLPTSDARQRKEITEEFFNYRHLTQSQLWDEYSAYEHWAKIEVPRDKEKLAALQESLRKRFPINAYNKARRELDPNRILSNGMLEKLFPIPETS